MAPQQADTTVGRSSTASGMVPSTLHSTERGDVAAPGPRRLDGSGYLTAVRACLPRWLQLIGPSPWLDDPTHGHPRVRRIPCGVYSQQSATLAVGLLAELEGDARDDHAYLFECVRTSLIRWQMSISPRGLPVGRKARSAALHGPIAGLIVQLLTETTGFQTDLLVDDLGRHLQWVAAQRCRSPWLEAETIRALSDAVLLVRDGSLLRIARGRLRELLHRQDAEGWFPERGGADIGRLSLTVDALASVYRQNDWSELAEPLDRAMGFLTHFVHPDGTAGGCYSSCGTGFVSPYGAELLADRSSQAAALAYVTRHRCEDFAAARLPAWSDPLCALLGSRLALAAAIGTRRPLAPAPLPCDGGQHVHFPNAGLSVYSNDAYHAVVSGRTGGSIRATWRDGSPDLVDPGVTVVASLRTHTSCRRDRHSTEEVSGSAVNARGVLRRPLRRHEPSRRWMRRLWRRLGLNRAAPTRSTDRARRDRQHFDIHRIAHDWFHREIAFGDETIQIQDRIHCRLPCHTVLCQSAAPGVDGRLIDHAASGLAKRPPLFVDGGRHVEITRVYRAGRLVDPSPK